MRLLLTSVTCLMLVASSSILAPSGCSEVFADDPYFKPHVLERGDIVAHEKVFGFHRIDSEKIRVALLDLGDCKKKSEQIAAAPPCAEPTSVQWVLPAGLGFVGGVGVTLLIFFLAR